MWNLNYGSIKEINNLLKENGFAPSKRFGQNFLLSSSYREKIVSSLGLKEGMRVWEIGPGLGSITSLLLREKVNVTAFEIDHGYVELLNEAFKDEDGFSIVEGDALKTIFKKRYLPLPERIVGNLPYNVGSVMIAKLIENKYLPERMVFTLQKEVVERMCAKVGDENYSSFSLLTSIDYKNTLSFLVPRSSFYPEPNVDSAVVVMERRNSSIVPDDIRDVFLSLVRDLFSKRRKTIRNNLLSSYWGNYGKDAIESAIKNSGLSGSERAEELSVDSLITLSRECMKVKNEQEG